MNKSVDVVIKLKPDFYCSKSGEASGTVCFNSPSNPSQLLKMVACRYTTKKCVSGSLSIHVMFKLYAQDNCCRWNPLCPSRAQADVGAMIGKHFSFWNNFSSWGHSNNMCCNDSCNDSCVIELTSDNKDEDVVTVPLNPPGSIGIPATYVFKGTKAEHISYNYCYDPCHKCCDPCCKYNYLETIKFTFDVSFAT